METVSVLIHRLCQEYPIQLELGENCIGLLILSKIYVPPQDRGRGYARRVMQQIIEYADQKGCILALTPSNQFGASLPRLIAFYRSLGFRPNKGRGKDYRISEQMIRQPHCQSDRAAAR